MPNKVTEKQFEEAIKGVLLRPVANPKKYENREPTKAELEPRFRLEQRKG